MVLVTGNRAFITQEVVGRSEPPTCHRSPFGRQRRGLSDASGHLAVEQRALCVRGKRVLSSAFSADLLSAGFFTAAAAGILYSALPLLTGKSRQDNQGKSDTYGETDADPDGIKWGVMSVVSFIPLVNWTVRTNKAPACKISMLSAQIPCATSLTSCAKSACRPGCSQR